MLGKENNGRVIRRHTGETSTVWSSKVSELINFFSGGGKFTSSLRSLRNSYTPYVTDLFLLENPKSNSQVTKRIQRNAISTRALV